MENVDLWAVLIDVGAALVVGFFSGWGIGTWAQRKGRPFWDWAVFGGILPLVALVVIACMSARCPRCREKVNRRDRMAGRCPNCDHLSRKNLPTSPRLGLAAKNWRQ